MKLEVKITGNCNAIDAFTNFLEVTALKLDSCSVRVSGKYYNAPGGPLKRTKYVDVEFSKSTFKEYKDC